MNSTFSIFFVSKRISFFLFFTLSFSLLFAQNDPPSNDEFANAIELTVQVNSCETQTSGTTRNTVGSSSNRSCLGVDPYGNASITTLYDVWYKATVPNSGKLTMEVADSATTNAQPVGFTVYVAGENGLTQIGCESGLNGDESFYLRDGTAGSVIYYQIVAFNQYNHTNRFDFNICVYEPDVALDLPQTQKPLLSYYSNPVGNRLALESPYQIQSLRVFDLMGKEVLRKTPNQQKLSLNTYSLAPGAYLLRVETPEGQQTVKLIKK